MKKKRVHSEMQISPHLVYALLICIAGIVMCASVRGLNRDLSITQFHHTAWTAKDGAPSQISALDQTTDGYLWIGSALGLFRFDGVTFEQYEPADGVQLPSHNIYALMATPDGGLWISFRPSGLGFLKDGKLKIFSRSEELPKSSVNCFGRTTDGKIWAGTNDGLSLFNGAGWDDIGAEWNFQPNTVKTLFTDYNGTLWISQRDQISFLPLGSKTFQVSEKIKKDDYPNMIAQEKNGRIWAANESYGISLIKDSASGLPAQNPILSIGGFGLLFDRDGCLWVATGKTVNRVRYPDQLRTGKYKKHDNLLETFTKSDGLSGNFASKIFEDREGNIWVGTFAGLDRFRNSRIVNIAVPDVNQKLTLYANAGNEIWAGSGVVESFLHIHDSQVDKVILPMKRIHDGQADDLFLTPKDSPTSSFYRDDDGSVWWGETGGIRHQQNNSFAFYPQPKDLGQEWIWEIFRGENDGGLWVSYGDLGLVYFNHGKWERRTPPEGLPNRGPSASFQDEQKRIWLGYTENRVFVLDGARVQGYSGANGIEIGRIKVIRGRGMNLWVGGELGLALFQNNRFYTVKTEDKPFGAISGIITTKNGDVWLNEAHGIINIPADEIRHLNENPEYAVKYQLFDFLDNLPGSPQMNFTVSTAIEATDKRLWFATDNGLAVIDPARSEKNVVPPPVIIKSVFADEKIYQVSPNTNFPAGTANIQVNYTATSLSIPERVVFKYRLEGYENQWREAGTRREAFYTNLAPGKYRFQVIAANNDGLWNEDGANLEFEILPVFYQTKWFLLICVVAFSGFIWAGYQWRVYRVKSRLQLLYEERLSERTRIAQELHDTFLQGVLGMTMRLQAISNLLPSKPENAKESLENVLNQADNVIEDSRRGIWQIRTSTVIENDLAQAFTLTGEELNKTYPANFTFTIEGASCPLYPLIRDEVYRIGREALINAFRHSQATEIEAGIEYSLKYLKIFVRDNGCGINPDILCSGREGHLGLSGMREFSEKIGAELKIWSREESGTEVELIVPHHVAFRKTSSGGLYNRLNNFSWRRKLARGRQTEREK